MMNRNTPNHIIFDEAMKHQERLEKLYGIGDYTGIIAKNIKHTIWLVAAFILLVILLLLFQIYRMNQLYHGVILDNKGNITSVIRPADGDATLVLDADIINDSGNTITNQGIKLMITPLQKVNQQETIETNSSVESQEDAIQHEIRKVLYEMNLDTSTGKVVLPKKLSDGTKIYWVPQKSYNGWLVIGVIIIGCFAIYYYRDSGLQRKEKEARESVLRELPEFVNTLVLLLNAGLILSNAFYKIISDYERIRGGENNYFYGQLSRIKVKCHETNGTVQHEIRSFAVRTGVVEFMRLSNIIIDSMTKGSDLMTQLKMEGDSLWAARRKLMEEKGKIAETKMTFPLVILLLVLLMITIAPAMMEM